MKLVLYIHGKNGNTEEANHYKSLFPLCEVEGLEYKHYTPWETGREIHDAVLELRDKYDEIIIIANSIGAFYVMNADVDRLIKKAWFISPIVDMERLITDMMGWSGITEQELQKRGTIHTEFGEDLSWEYLRYVREHPMKWRVPTDILYGSEDNFTSVDTVTAFAKANNARLTVMEGGEHWFHTDKQMMFLDNWIRNAEVF